MEKHHHYNKVRISKQTLDTLNITLYNKGIQIKSGGSTLEVEYSFTRLVKRTIGFGHTSLATGGFTWKIVNLAGLDLFGDYVGISEVTLNYLFSLVATMLAN